jgi:transposase-like protein
MAARKWFTPEEIIGKLREAEVVLATGKTVADICRQLGVTQVTYFRWRREYGGLKIDQARRLKELERENTRLRRAVADLTLDKLILKEATEGNW